MNRAHGVTLVECLIAMTILSCAVLTTCFTLSAAQQQLHYGDRVASAARLAEDLLEEIAGRHFRDHSGAPVFGREPDEKARTLFDDVDDYHNFFEAPGLLTNSSGELYPESDQAFSRRVTVTAGTLNVTDLGRTVAGLTVIVTVRGPDGKEWSFTRFITECGR